LGKFGLMEPNAFVDEMRERSGGDDFLGAEIVHCRIRLGVLLG
jgi:hypothetical protein